MHYATCPGTIDQKRDDATGHTCPVVATPNAGPTPAPAVHSPVGVQKIRLSTVLPDRVGGSAPRHTRQYLVSDK